MAVRTTANTTPKLFILAEFHETDASKNCKKTAIISSPLFREPVDVFYKEYRSLMGLGFGDVVIIEVIEPIKFKVVEQGFNAQERCETSLCIKIEKVFSQKQLLNIHKQPEESGI